MVRRPPTLLGNARIFPSCITAILPLFIDWKGNDLVRKKCICPPLTHDPITTWFISPMSFHRFKCYEKKMIQSPLIHFLFLHIPRSGLWWFRSSKLTFIKKWHFWNYDSCPQKKTITNKRLNVNVQKKEPIFKPRPSKFPSILIYSFDTAEILISLLIRVFNEWGTETGLE